ncbi:sly1 [Hyphodiscus hymeniophilus]|uniref:Sly1 n=1 Tax=Hyphodiscus hymeniophilus TaxID=353542 RepID=A0A9P6VDI7_9HELO|nr:sly1 [Hyphodiscus hymeniophilus]
MATTSHNSLRDRQIRSIERMLNLNHDSGEGANGDSDHAAANGLAVPTAPILNSDGDPIWKVLVFDDLGRDVISSVLRVNDLRTWGVTMHMHIASARHPIPDVPVLYLVEPTASNLHSITSDLSKGLYSPAYINFLSSIPRPLLEDFAKQTAEAGTSESIAQFYDQYLNFIVGEPDLFSLGMRKENTYWALNSARTQDEELDHVIDRIVSGLFSVMVTMGVMPIIRCPKGAAAEMISAKLDRKLRDHILNSKDNLFSTSSSRPSTASGTPSSRPVLVILDRNVDLIPMLSHSWTYQSLVHDVLNMKLNRITVETPIDETAPAKGTTKKAYDLTANDFFWAKNAGVPFPQVAEDIDAELMRYRDEANEITKKTGASSIEDLQSDTPSAGAQHLQAAITKLPELRERKAVLDMHMNILAGLLNGIKNRQLDNYYQMEENIMKQTTAQMLELLSDQDKGNNPMDKLRLFIIWFLSTEQNVSRQDLEKFEEALKAAGADTTSLAYVKQYGSRDNTHDNDDNSTNTNPRPSFRLRRALQRLLLHLLTPNLLPQRIRGGCKLRKSDIRSQEFPPGKPRSHRDQDLRVDHGPRRRIVLRHRKNGELPLLRSEERECERHHAATERGEEGRYDAWGMGSASGPGMGATFGQRRQGFSEAIVFTVGGGSMDEYGNLQEWAKRTGAGGSGAEKGAGRRRVVYGSTELVNAEEFLKVEFEKLGAELA